MPSNPDKRLAELLENVTRLTLIDHSGRASEWVGERWKIKIVPLLQDDNRTLKLVIQDNPTAKDWRELMPNPDKRLEEILLTFLAKNGEHNYVDKSLEEAIAQLESLIVESRIDELKGLPIQLHAAHASHNDYCVSRRIIKSRLDQLKRNKV